MERLTFRRLPEEVDVEEGHVVATYYVETPPSVSVREAAEAVCAEQSTGTWLRVLEESVRFREAHGAKLLQFYQIPKREKDEINRGVFSIAFPTKHFGPRIPNMLSTVAGNLFEIKDFLNIRLVDLRFPKDFLERFKGPRFGLRGTMEAVGVKGRPMVGCIMKPDVGFNPEELAQQFYLAVRGGLDFIKDDELYGAMGSGEYSPLDERVTRVMEAVDKANSEKERREKTLYAVNITDEVSRLLVNADIAQKHGANCIMVNFVTVGLSGLRMLAEDPSVKVPIHAHRDMFAALTRPYEHGLSTAVIMKLARLAGGDQIHLGSIRGKMYEPEDEVIQSAEICRFPMKNIAPALPCASGRNHAGTVAITVQKLGIDILLLTGGGVFGHPMGPSAGARSLRRALEAYLSGIPIEECAKTYKEVEVALNTWGYVKPE